MLIQKIAQYFEYKKLKKIVKEKAVEVENSKITLDTWANEISRLYEVPGPYVCPTNWGTDDFPCEVVYQDKSTECPTMFHCPYFDSMAPCAKFCAKQSDNKTYFELKSIYNMMNREHEQAVANLEAARTRLLGRSK